MERNYKVREFPHLKGLKGLSDVQLEQHFKLYEGYVKNTNLLREQIAEMLVKGQSETPIFAELVRRLPFEQNGMVLHEYYFDNMVPNGGEIPKGGALNKAIDESFGSIDSYKKELMSMAKMRGVGWVMTLQDPTTGWLANRWVTLHQDGNIAGYRPVLVLDIWEHAWTVDYKPTERAKYLDAWFTNVNWKKVEERITAR
ncbi:MAG TPA: Fe-Mn family superoxide dismutase [Myxococcales bacterium]|jgi:Fe-Mn family superoxide dismutase